MTIRQNWGKMFSTIKACASSKIGAEPCVKRGKIHLHTGVNLLGVHMTKNTQVARSIVHIAMNALFKVSQILKD